MPGPEMQHTRGYESTVLATLSTSGQILSGYEQAKAVYFYASADLCEVESIKGRPYQPSALSS